ncbi:SubName: Full=Uncharacterized protein {ECO:0000313/EMBL:CCA72880.1} [Serendipita indica DSM 11827]|nr:SubName: Full=Uncharacterized protein {ECO:0000313/EMBL:CCA72880.1} [Serendipita indica DSM 11827]
MSTVPFFRLIILHFILFSCSCALRWPFQPSSRASKRIPELAASQELKVDDLTMTDVEKRMLFRSIDTLSSYKTGSGCFYDASMDLSKRCDELESNQEGRVLAAIRFTLCELETADFLKPPAECEQYIRRDTRGLSHCVEALHRSPQFWSSYSGYLREIPQLCTAYRRLHDIDTAKGLYHNATQEKIYLLHLLQQRELIYQEQQRQLIANLNNLGEVETKLKQSATMFGIKGDTVLSNFETMLHQAKRHVFDLHSQLSTTITEQTRIHGDQLSRLVRRTENEHEAVLHTLLHDTSTAIGTIVKALHDISDKSDMLALSMETTQGEWRKLDESTMTLGNVIVSLTNTVEQVSHDLERQSVMVHEMTVHQENFSKYMHGIEMAMSQMMTVIYGHIENVTHASTAAQLRLSQNKHGGLNLRLVLEAAQLIWMSDWSE